MNDAFSNVVGMECDCLYDILEVLDQAWASWSKISPEREYRLCRGVGPSHPIVFVEVLVLHGD